MYDFEFLRPSAMEDALSALEDEDALILAGGQTLIPTLKQRLAAPTQLVSLAGLDGLDFVKEENGHLQIGAMTRHEDVARLAGRYPALAALAGQIGDPAVRARGTIGGSVANNDPSACYPAAVLGSRSQIVTSQRSINCDDFFLGLFETALEPGEMITQLHFEIPKRAAYMKFRQPASRFALAAAFVAEYEDEIRVAITGGGDDGVFRWQGAEKALSDQFVPQALDGLDLDADTMIGDVHAGPDYRAHLCKVMTMRAVAACV